MKVKYNKFREDDYLPIDKLYTGLSEEHIKNRNKTVFSRTLNNITNIEKLLAIKVLTREMYGKAGSIEIDICENRVKMITICGDYPNVVKQKFAVYDGIIE